MPVAYDVSPAPDVPGLHSKRVDEWTVPLIPPGDFYSVGRELRKLLGALSRWSSLH